MNPSLPVSLQTIGLLIGSNLFMTVAWYGHLEYQADRSWPPRCASHAAVAPYNSNMTGR